MDSQCQNGLLPAADYYIESYCNVGLSECVYVTAPADIAEGWTIDVNDNLQPYVRVRIGMFSDEETARKAPILREWYVTYNCIDAD